MESTTRLVQEARARRSLREEAAGEDTRAYHETGTGECALAGRDLCSGTECRLRSRFLLRIFGNLENGIGCVQVYLVARARIRRSTSSCNLSFRGLPMTSQDWKVLLIILLA